MGTAQFAEFRALLHRDELLRRGPGGLDFRAALGRWCIGGHGFSSRRGRNGGGQGDLIWTGADGLPPPVNGTARGASRFNGRVFFSELIDCTR
ncbi:hypothetical protein GCM10010329_09250 [Streptomyces spiroverticillatus]|nr:hypothetical protein GCM10010329_09250 [Streptomyces spiroverticillatus]